MAKKVVATLQTGEGRTYSKVIKMVRSEKTGAYLLSAWFLTTRYRMLLNN